MNIGVFMGDIQPEIGGAFSFQESIFNAILETPTNHSIVVFYYGKPKVSPRKHVHYVAIPKPTAHISNMMHKTKRFIADTFLEQLIQKPFSSLEKAVIEYDIELVWFLSPHHEIIRFPYITIVWDLEHRLSPYFPEFSYQGWTWDQRENNYKHALPKASIIITGTKVGKREIQDFYGIPEARIKILPHPTPGYVLKKGHGSVAPEFIKKLPQHFFFYPAQFWAHKNHIGILHALALIRKDHELTMHVVFAGSNQGNLAFVKEKAKELELAEQVHFLGFVSQNELVYLYQHAVALVYASFCGPENLPPLEAMALDCPVIASDIPGSREQLGKNALLFNPLDDHSLAKAMHTLFSDTRKRRELIKLGQHRALAYKPSDFVNDVFEHIEAFSIYRRTWVNIKQHV